MKKIICVAIMILCVISVKADEKTRQLANEIQQDREALEAYWQKCNAEYEAKFKNIDKLRGRAVEIESVLGKNYLITKEETYESLNDLKNSFIHKRTKEENYDIVAKGILTMLASNGDAPLDNDIKEIFKNADNKSTTDGSKLCSHDDAIQIRKNFNILQDQETKNKLSKENLLYPEEYFKIWDTVMEQYTSECQKHEKLVADLNVRINAFNAYLKEREKIIDEKIRQNENWQMQQKIEEINNKIDSLQMNQR